MKHIYNSKKNALGVCLIISQLLAFQGVWAKSASQVALGGSPEFRSVSIQKKQSPKYPKSLLFSQPGGGEFQISASAGYALINADFGGFFQSTGYNKVKSEMTGVASEISAAYGFTDNFYSKVTLNYDNLKSSQSVTNSSSIVSSDSVRTTDGLKEPSILLGAQTRLGSTQLFAELSVDIPLGDSVERKISVTETTDNNLKGGMSYSPRLGVVHDLGNMLIMGGASYTLKDDRTEKHEGFGYSTTSSVKGGNSTELLTGVELKNLSRWGFVLGYTKEDSTEKKSDQSYEVSTSPGYAVASSYLGIKIGSATYLIPKLSYSTVLDRKVATGVSQIDINQYDWWNFNVGARVNF